MPVPLLSKIVLAVLLVPVTCAALCTFDVQPVRNWMMRHHCPFAMHMEHEPSQTMP